MISTDSGNLSFDTTGSIIINLSAKLLTSTTTLNVITPISYSHRISLRRHLHHYEKSALFSF